MTDYTDEEARLRLEALMKERPPGENLRDYIPPEDDPWWDLAVRGLAALIGPQPASAKALRRSARQRYGWSRTTLMNVLAASQHPGRTTVLYDSSSATYWLPEQHERKEQIMKDIETRELQVRLTPSEQRARAQQLAATRMRLRQEEAEERERRQELNRRRRELEAKLDALSEAVSTGTELRAVECRRVVQGETTQIVRSDTGEVVEERPATYTERQLQIETETVEVPRLKAVRT